MTYKEVEAKLLEEFEKLGDYHEVDGEDEYEPPSMEETRMFLEKQLPSLLHAYERETEVEKKRFIHRRDDVEVDATGRHKCTDECGYDLDEQGWNAAVEAVEKKRNQFWE